MEPLLNIIPSSVATIRIYDKYIQFNGKAMVRLAYRPGLKVNFYRHGNRIFIRSSDDSKAWIIKKYRGKLVGRIHSKVLCKALIESLGGKGIYIISEENCELYDGRMHYEIIKGC